ETIAQDELRGGTLEALIGQIGNVPAIELHAPKGGELFRRTREPTVLHPALSVRGGVNGAQFTSASRRAGDEKKAKREELDSQTPYRYGSHHDLLEKAERAQQRPIDLPGDVEIVFFLVGANRGASSAAKFAVHCTVVVSKLSQFP